MNNRKIIDARAFREELGEILMAARSLIVYEELTRLPALRCLAELLEGLLEKSWGPARLIESYTGFLNAFLSSIPWTNPILFMEGLDSGCSSYIRRINLPFGQKKIRTIYPRHVHSGGE